MELYRPHRSVYHPGVSLQELLEGGTRRRQAAVAHKGDEDPPETDGGDVQLWESLLYPPPHPVCGGLELEGPARRVHPQGEGLAGTLAQQRGPDVLSEVVRHLAQPEGNGQEGVRRAL